MLKFSEIQTKICSIFYNESEELKCRYKAVYVNLSVKKVN